MFQLITMYFVHASRQLSLDRLAVADARPTDSSRCPRQATPAHANLARAVHADTQVDNHPSRLWYSVAGVRQSSRQQRGQMRRAGGRCCARPLAAVLVIVLSLAPRTAGGDWSSTAEADKAAAAAATSRAWAAVHHRVGSLVLEGRRVGEVLGPILVHDFTLPPSQLAKSLVYTGANYRLRRVVHDLVTARRPLRVGAIGGSITHGAKASERGRTDWFSLVGAYLRSAFPRAEISTRNGALPATPSALMNMCLEQYVDDDVDLVFVE